MCDKSLCHYLVAAALTALACTLAGPVRAAEPTRLEQVPEVDAVHAEAVAAYRDGDVETAQALWESLLSAQLPDAARAQLYENLGNAAWRRAQPAAAVAWYTSAGRLAPRRLELRSDLEFVRREAGMEATDRGDLRSTVARLLSLVTPRESGVLLLGGLALLALVLAGEALRGGLFWRRLAVAAALLAALSAVPWAWHHALELADPVMVVAAEPEPLVSEPRADLAPLGTIEPGLLLERIDALPGWVRVETAAGGRGWVPEGAVQALGR